MITNTPVQQIKYIEVPYFDKIKEYCSDGYEEYFDKITTNNLKKFTDEIYRHVLLTDQPKMLEYILDRIPIDQDKIFNLIISSYRGGYNEKEILDVILKKYPNIKYSLINNIIKIVESSKLNFVIEIYKLRSTTQLNLPFTPIQKYWDINVFYWLIDLNAFDLTKTKDIVKLLFDYLKSDKVKFINFKKTIEKLKFDNNNLSEIFITSNESYSYLTVLEALLINKQVEIIYFLFEHVKPELIIKTSNIARIVEQLVKYGDYSLFMFIMKHVFTINFESLNNLTHNYYLQNAVNYNDNSNTDKKIILELIKLKIEPKKGTKYYDYYLSLNFY